jgi:hypothetical protein
MGLMCLIGKHKWDGCKCLVCGKTRNEGHDWKKDCQKCSRCGMERRDAHKWNGCKCSVCGKTRDEGHDWEGCKCRKCAKVIDLQDELWDALEKRDSVRAIQFLSLGANPNATLPTGESVFRIACVTDQYDIAEVIVKAGATLEKLPSDYLIRPFFKAISVNDLTQTAQLLFVGANPNAVLSNGGSSAFDTAVVCQALDVAELLLLAGANPNINTTTNLYERCLKKSKDDWTPKEQKEQWNSLAKKIRESECSNLLCEFKIEREAILKHKQILAEKIRGYVDIGIATGDWWLHHRDTWLKNYKSNAEIDNKVEEHQKRYSTKTENISSPTASSAPPSESESYDTEQLQTHQASSDTIDRLIETIKHADGPTAGGAAMELKKLLGVQAVGPLLAAIKSRKDTHDADTRVFVTSIVYILTEIGQPAVYALAEVLNSDILENEIPIACALAALKGIGGDEANLAIKHFMAKASKFI